MEAWLTFLAAEHGAVDNATITSFGEEPGQYPALAEQATVTPLTDRGVISVTGTDTNRFLQGQLTCDIDALQTGATVPGALCEVKGRMIASFHAFRLEAETIVLILHRGLVDETLTTLNKYAPFYKATLGDVSDQYRVLGINGKGLEAAGGWPVTVTESRTMQLVPADDAESVWRGLTPEFTPTGLPYWEFLSITDGLAEVRPETSGEFIPQMLNLQHTGAISFRKGCYTGQEIVARMQYLGKLKRRLYRLKTVLTDVPPPGTPIHTGDKANAGTLAMAQRSGNGEVQALAVLTAEAAAEQRLTFGESGTDITVLDLPYDDKFDAAR